MAIYTRAKDKADLFEALAKVPTYVLDNTRRQANTRRLLSLARKLTMDGIDAEAWAEAKTLAVETLKAESARLRKNPEFAAKVSGKATINIKEFKVEFGELRELKESRTIAVEVTSENIDDLFTKCETILGEGLKDEYWRRVHDHEEPDRAKAGVVLYPAGPRVGAIGAGGMRQADRQTVRAVPRQDRGDAVEPAGAVCANWQAGGRPEGRENSSAGTDRGPQGNAPVERSPLRGRCRQVRMEGEHLGGRQFCAKR